MDGQGEDGWTQGAKTDGAVERLCVLEIAYVCEETTSWRAEAAGEVRRRYGGSLTVSDGGWSCWMSDGCTICWMYVWWMYDVNTQPLPSLRPPYKPHLAYSTAAVTTY